MATWRSVVRELGGDGVFRRFVLETDAWRPKDCRLPCASFCASTVTFDIDVADVAWVIVGRLLPGIRLELNSSRSAFFRDGE